MNDNTSYREKGRAVFLAAIMVLSVVAMSAAFAGSAAAAVSVDEDLSVTPDKVHNDSVVEHDIEITFTEVDLSESDNTTVNITVDNGAVLSVDPDDDLTVENDSDPLNVENKALDAQDHGFNITDDLSSDENVTISGPVTVDYNPATDDVNFDVAIEDDGGATANDAVTISVEDNDATPDYEPDLAFEGQTVNATSDSIFAGENYNLRSVDETDGVVTSSSQEDQLTGSDGYVEIDTDGLDDGDYFLRGPGLTSSPDATDGTFEVTTQSLAVEFDDEEVTNDGDGSVTDLEIDSDRGTYTLEVSADGDLDDEELFGIFAPNADYDTEKQSNAVTEDDIDDGNVDANDGVGLFNVVVLEDNEDDEDEVIYLVDINDLEEEVDFHDIDADEYDFDFENVDTEAEATASITVAEYDIDGSFSQGVYTQTAGDYQQFTLELEDTDEAWIQIGDENAGFVDVVHVEDDSDNGEVSFWVNTRHLGSPNEAWNGGVDSDLVYYSDDDEIESLFHDGSLSEGVTFEEDDGSPLTYELYLDELGIIDESEDDYWEQLARPLQPTDYSVTASADGTFVVDDGESEADDELDQATLDLIEPEIGEINTYVAPAEDADDADIEELLSEVELTPRTEVAEDDRLVIEVEATGLYGALGAASDEAFSIMTDGASAEGLYELAQNDSDWESEGINFNVEADDAIGNQDPTVLDLDTDEDDEVYVLVDNENGAFYVVVDSGADVWDGGLDTPHEFDVDFEYETDDDDRYRFDGTGADVAYPYYGTDSDESVSTTFDVADPAVAFDNLDADDNVQIETSEEATVSGETNVAPGSEADVRFRAAGDTPSFLNTPEATIDSDGTFESEEIDFSDRAEGDEATITFRVGGSSVDSADGIFVEAVEETDDEEPADDEPAETDDDEPAETDDDEPAPSDDDGPAPTADDGDDDVGTEGDGVPGFGLAIAVVALLAAAMLALRRQH